MAKKQKREWQGIPPASTARREDHPPRPNSGEPDKREAKARCLSALHHAPQSWGRGASLWLSIHALGGRVGAFQQVPELLGDYLALHFQCRGQLAAFNGKRMVNQRNALDALKVG